MQSQTELQILLRDPVAMRERYAQFRQEKNNGVTATFSDGDPAYLAFQYNVNLAYERNLRSNGRVLHGITGLMDLTRDQFRKLLGYKRNDFTDAPLPQPEEVLKLQPASQGGSRDWRDEGAVTPVKDQGQCGSCWAFSTVESVESAALVQGLADKDDPFVGSPQELVSCDTAGLDSGCDGGLPSKAFDYLRSTPLEPESDFPYTSGVTKLDGTCRLDESDGVFEVESKTQVSLMGLGETQDIADYMLNQGPLSVAVHANDEWQTYMGGIMGVDTCPDDQRPNHAVQAVALNREEDTPYWVIRNSWNTNWGEDGYIRLEYGQNVCNVAYEGVGVTVKRAEGAKKASLFLNF